VADGRDHADYFGVDLVEGHALVAVQRSLHVVFIQGQGRGVFAQNEEVEVAFEHDRAVVHVEHVLEVSADHRLVPGADVQRHPVAELGQEVRVALEAADGQGGGEHLAGGDEVFRGAVQVAVVQVADFAPHPPHLPTLLCRLPIALHLALQFQPVFGLDVEEFVVQVVSRLERPDQVEPPGLLLQFGVGHQINLRYRRHFGTQHYARQFHVVN